MPANQPASRRTMIAILFTLAAALMLAAWNQVTAGAPTQPVGVAARRAPVSGVLAAHETRGVPNGDITDHAARTVAPPPLIEILRAADLLAQAHALPSSSTEPPLIEILQAADQLAKAGLLPAPAPPLIEILQAASILAEAGVLPTPAGEHEGEQAHTGEPPRQGAPAPAPPAPTATPVPLIVPTPTVAPPPPPPAPAPRPTPQQEPTQPAGAGWYDETFSSHLFDLVNAERAKAGVPPVNVEPRLALAASRYAKVLSDNDWFSHTGPDGSTLVDRVEAAGFPFDVQVGEVLAWGNEHWAAGDIVQAWLNSPSHREQILHGVYTRAGVGCYFTPEQGGTVYCVMDFAG